MDKVQTIENVDWGHVSGILGRILDDPAPTRYISNPRLIVQLKMLVDFTDSGGFATTREQLDLAWNSLVKQERPTISRSRMTAAG